MRIWVWVCMKFGKGKGVYIRNSKWKRKNFFPTSTSRRMITTSSHYDLWLLVVLGYTRNLNKFKFFIFFYFFSSVNNVWTRLGQLTILMPKPKAWPYRATGLVWPITIVGYVFLGQTIFLHIGSSRKPAWLICHVKW